ncbi:hypothetical protein D3C87_1938380 [compost metagenome]
MPGKWQFDLGREDPDGSGIALDMRLEDEHRLAEVELACYGLHFAVEQPVGLTDDGELIALEPLAGEHVQQQIIELHVSLYSLGSA